MTMTSTAAAAGTAEPRTEAGPFALGAWMLFDWAAQPFYTLVTTFLFAPYFSDVYIGNAAQGAALWGYTMAVSAIIVAIGSPILGAIADARGKLKGMIAWQSVGFVIGQLVLWYAIPGASSYLWLVLLGLLLATVTGEFAAVLNNSLMPRLARPDQLGRLSGGGWALGYVGGLISLVLMAAFVLVDTQTGKTMLGLSPIWTLDAATHEMDRIVSPLSALWYIIFVIPFFIFTPDAPANPDAQRVSAWQALAGLGTTLSHIGRYRNLVAFFIARMLFIDGLLAIFTFGGIYAKSIFGWQTIVVGYFGIILSIAAGIGALIGGILDDRVGAKPVIIWSVALLIIGSLGVMSIDERHIFFTLDVAPRAADAAPFASTGEIFYMAFAILIGLASGPSQAACRSLLARLAPAEHMSEFFGFFAFSGKVTAFAAPFVIGLVSNSTGSLQKGMSVILLFLLAGIIGMIFVRTDDR